ncbi:hypothetical protein [Donghicola mangrovi]|uniref:hypothetical protein n=1 Tax=Donghicola mangrovi TaxID=2729614 RepID=UPI001884A3DD|nr:hypothetical protein [Donghicola mangrovi]
MGIDTDLALVVGVVVGAFALPSIVSAMIDGRSPRVAMVTIVISGVSLVYALKTQPGGYELGDVPRAFAAVMGRYIH